MKAYVSDTEDLKQDPSYQETWDDMIIHVSILIFPMGSLPCMFFSLVVLFAYLVEGLQHHLLILPCKLIVVIESFGRNISVCKILNTCYSVMFQ